MRRFALPLVLFSLTVPAAAGVLTPYLVKDLNPGTIVEHPRPDFFSARAVGDLVFFKTEGLQAGVWRTDGSAAGTHRIYDGLLDHQGWDFNDVSAAGDEVYFAWRTPEGNHLFRTDGSTPGTHFVTNVAKWSDGAPCGEGKVCFAGANMDIGVTDGTAQGTSLLANTAPGVSVSSWWWNLTPFAGRVFFNAYDPQHGRCITVDSFEEVACGEMWVSDGTAQGTRLFKDLNPGWVPGAPYDLFVSRHARLYFRALRPGTAWCEMWSTDGTPEGTFALLPNAPTYNCTAFISPIVEAGEHVYFMGAFGEVFQSRGTPATTVSVWPEQSDYSRKASGLSVVGNKLLIATVGGLWTSDGKDAIELVRGNVRILGHLTATGRTYFTKEGDLWSTDGTAEGTRKDFRLRRGSPTAGAPAPFAVTARQLYYIYLSSSGNDDVIFVTDGTESGTRTVDLSHTLGDGSSPWDLLPFGDNLLFTTQDPLRHSVSDGTSDGTTAFAPAADRSPMFLHEGRVYFHEKSYETGSLWTTDGTPAGTRRVSDWLGGRKVNDLPAFAGDTAVFADFDGDEEVLMRSAPGAAATPLALRGQMSGFTSLGDRVAFWRWESDRSSYALMITDGTDSGTRRVASDFQSRGGVMAFAGGALFGGRSKDGKDLSLSMADLGAGTVAAIRTIPAKRDDDEIIPLLSWRGLALFAVGDPDLLEWQGETLWRSDGTAAGTYPLSDKPFLHVVPDGGGLTLIREIHGEFLPGWEIWHSDGTAAGTFLRYSSRTELKSGPLLLPGGEVAIAHLSGRDELHLRNTRTNAVTVISLGALEIGPVVYAGGRLNFAGCRATTGCELWAVPLDGSAVSEPSAVRITYQGTAAGVEGRVAVFRVSVTTRGSARASVIATTVDGTLIAGRDYVPFTKEIVFDNDRDVTLTVPLLETGTQGTMSVVLSSPVNATIVDGIATTQAPGRRRSARQ